MPLRKSWDSYNYAKARRLMANTAAQLAVVERPCEDCGGKGVDSGALNGPEACPECKGSGVQLASERAERKGPGTATTALPDSSTVEERRTNLK